MRANLDRALLLLQQSRHELAEKELRRALAEEPVDPTAHALLSLCLCEQKRWDEATAEAQHAIHLSPAMAYAHFVLAKVLASRGRPEEARSAITEAIRLSPEDADYWNLLAAIHLELRQWTESLAAAERGLQMDAEHQGCLNVRAMALVRLGRRREAGQTIEAALARDPEDALTHANEGWRLLHTGEAQKALEHFREALRLEPTLEWARLGIVEAMKARNIVYRWMLRYFLWMARLSPAVQWGLVFGAWMGQRFLRGLAKAYPPLAPWVWPVVYVYLGFVALTWLAEPLSNLALRMSRFGRLALSREQTITSNLIGGLLLGALAGVAGTLVTDADSPVTFALVCGLMVIPTARIYQCEPGWPRMTMLAITGGLGLLGAASVAALALAGLADPGPQKVLRALGGLAFLAFAAGVFLSAFGGMYLSSARVRR